MPRRLRLRIAVGLCLIVVGLAVAVLTPIAVSLLPTTTVTIDNLGDAMADQIRLGQTIQRIVLGGFGVAILGFLLAFLTWIGWLMRPDEKPAA